MDMSVVAAAHTVLVHHFKKFRDAVLHKNRRIVQKQHLLLLAKPLCILKGCPDPARLAVDNLFVVLLSLFKHPAAGAAQTQSFHADRIVVQDAQTVQPVFFQKALHLCAGGPPVVVVALHQDFFSGQPVQKKEILLCLLQTHPPGNISRDDDGILRLHH